MGIDMVSKIVRAGNETVRVQVWDTAGQEKFRSLIPTYLKQADAIIAVYDITSKAAYKNR